MKARVGSVCILCQCAKYMPYTAGCLNLMKVKRKKRLKKWPIQKKNLTRYKIDPSRNQDVIYINLLLKIHNKLKIIHK